ncbi:MAG: Ldh family oxidoreductase [Paracoccaceae bacterium]
MDTERLGLDAIERLAFDALTAAGAAETQARPLAAATAETEAIGVASHGLAYVPIYCEHLRCGKVDGRAVPEVSRPKPGVVRVDARNGFAHAAIEAGLAPLVEAARAHGVAALAIHESYNCGALRVHSLRLAREGLLALGFTNAPASIAAAGGTAPVLGTNPFSVAAPDGEGGAAVLIDQSASVIAKSEIMARARAGEPIPEGWALDAEGRPTTDPAAALKGSMAPAGGRKGVGLALTTELFAAAAAGALLGIEASPFSGTVGGPPRTGQFFLAVDAEATSGGVFAKRLAALLPAIRASGEARVPGDGARAAHAAARRDGVEVASATLARIAAA